MHELGIDIETYSEIDLEKSGMHRYIEHPSFEILLISFSVDEGPVHTIDLATMNGEGPDPDDLELYEWFLDMLRDPYYLKTAWNAQFERECFNKHLNTNLPIEQWECTMCKASMLSYPMSLDKTAEILKLEVKKDKRGKELIRLFSVLSKATKRNPVRKRTHYYENPKAWLEYISYNRTDVVVEQTIRIRLKFYKIPKREKAIWNLDQKINKNGVMIDPVLVDQALKLAAKSREKLMKEAIEITGIANPNSTPQLKKWLEQNPAIQLKKLDKEVVKTLLKAGHDDKTNRMLEIRQELNKASIKKFKPMQLCVNDDGRARGLFQYNGASKTGRWASRLIQLHNLSKNKMPDIDLARQLVREGNFEDIELLYGNINSVLGELVRPAFIAPPGKTLLASDYAAIEARMLAWLANEQWKLEVFRTTGKIYEEAGARMFRTTPEAIAATKNEPTGLRFKAKTAELAFGFQGGVGSLIRMEEMGLKTGLTHDEMGELVKIWRAANKKIVKFWYDLDDCAIAAVKEPGKLVTLRYLKFIVKQNILFLQLPSGRLLSYVNPHIRENKFEREAVNYYGIDDKHKWTRLEMYGGKWAENVTQGASRDVLANGMLALDEAGFKMVMHVHDEVVSEIEIGTEAENEKKAGEILGRDIPWAPNLPLKAVSFTSPYYIKEA